MANGVASVRNAAAHAWLAGEESNRQGPDESHGRADPLIKDAARDAAGRRPAGGDHVPSRATARAPDRLTEDTDPVTVPGALLGGPMTEIAGHRSIVATSSRAAR